MTQSIKDMVKDGQQVTFTHYKHKQLWYKTDSGFAFPVDIEDAGEATFLDKDKALIFMRYIRKQLAAIEAGKADSE